VQNDGVAPGYRHRPLGLPRAEGQAHAPGLAAGAGVSHSSRAPCLLRIDHHKSMKDTGAHADGSAARGQPGLARRPLRDVDAEDRAAVDTRVGQQLGGGRERARC
jgi:hypothetical protein